MLFAEEFLTSESQQQPLPQSCRAPAGQPAGDPDRSCSGEMNPPSAKVLLRKTLVRASARPMVGMKSAPGSAGGAHSLCVLFTSEPQR